MAIVFIGMGTAAFWLHVFAAPLPDVPWSFPPPTSEKDTRDVPRPFAHLPAKTPENLWRHLADVDLTDPSAVLAATHQTAPQPPDRPVEPPLDRPGWVTGPLLEQLYRDMLDENPEVGDRIIAELKGVKGSKESEPGKAEALEMMRALVSLRAGKASMAKAQFAEQKRCTDLQLRAFATAYCEMLRKYPEGLYEGKNLADWITFRLAGPDLAAEWHSKLERKLAVTLRDPTEGPHALLRKSADNLDRLKDLFRMADVFQTDSANDLLPDLFQHEHNIRLAAFEADVRALQTTRQALTAAAAAIKPRFGANTSARQMLDMLGQEMEYTPATRVIEHNQLIQQLRDQWAQALKSLRSVDRFLSAAGDRIPKPISAKDREALALTIWSAPYVDDLGPEVRDMYTQKSRPQGRVFFALKPCDESRRVLR